jgi:Chromo (CHRromatin Organisation MOdifier) domain
MPCGVELTDEAIRTWKEWLACGNNDGGKSNKLVTWTKVVRLMRFPWVRRQAYSSPAYIAIEGANTTRPFAWCSMDLITDLPSMEGYDSILVMVDRGLLRGVNLCPCTKTITWQETATLLQDNLFKRFGLPDKMISDRDPRFAAHAFQELLKLLNIKLNLTTAYHPQSDGTTERINQEIEAYLSIYCTSHLEDWLHLLSTLEFTHNNQWHTERVHTPFELIQGDSPISIPITFSHTKFPSIEEKMKQMINDREEALAAHELARTRIANSKQSNFSPFEKNQKVWLDTRNLKMNHHKKIAPKQEGPFEIDKILGLVTYGLKLPNSWEIHNMFHATLLRPYIRNKVYGNNYPRPLPELLEGKEVYEVETILKHWQRGRGYQYYVKWKGYFITKAAWKNKSAFSNDGDMIQQYKDWYQL